MKYIILLVLLAHLTGCSENTPPKTGFEDQPIPAVNLLLTDSSSYLNTKDIPKGQWTVLFYFSPECPYCRAQMTEITEKINQLKAVRIYAMTFGRFNSFKDFSDEFKLNKFSNITTGLDYTYSIGRHFKLKSVPFTAIYNPQNKLSGAFFGKISVNQIKDVIGS